MKNRITITLFHLLLMGLLNSAIAQVKQGTIMIGGGFGLKSVGEETGIINGNSLTTPGYITYHFNPEVGYFINSHISMGVYFSSKAENEAQVLSTNNKTSAWIISYTSSVGLFTRNIIPISEHVFFTQSLSAGYISRQYNDKVASSTDPSLIEDGVRIHTDGFTFGISPGLTYFIHPKWGIEITLNNLFSYAKFARQYDYKSLTLNSSQSAFNIGLGINPTFGLYYYWNK